MNCPVCHNPNSLPSQEYGSVASCSSCGTSLRVGVNGLVAHPNKNTLPAYDASPVYIGMKGIYGGKEFTIHGQLQYFFDNGPENQWYLIFDDGSEGWLCESFGLYTMSLEIDYRGPRARQLGNTVIIGNNEYIVTSIKKKEHVQWAGFLPFDPAVEEKFTNYEMQQTQGLAWASVTVYPSGKELIYMSVPVNLSELSLHQ